MPTSVWARLTVALAAALSPLGAQSLPMIVDCGDLNGFPTGEPGYDLLTETGGLPGVTLIPAALDTVHVNANPTQMHHPTWPVDIATIDIDQLDQRHRFTSLMLSSPTRLRIDGMTPDTPYRVKLELGALYPWVEQEDFEWVAKDSASTDIAVDVEIPFTSTTSTQWTNAVSDVRCTTPFKPTSFESNVASVVSVWVKVYANDEGRLNLRLRSEAGASAPVFLTAFEVHEHEELPIIYRRNASGPLVAQNPAAQSFVTLFNAGDYEGAQAWALSHSNTWRRGVALLHLVGWLDGSRDGRWHLLDEAEAALVSATSAHPGARWLLDEVRSTQRALAHFDARGYEWAYKCPDEGGSGFLNRDCAENLSWSANGQSISNVNAYVTMRELAGIVATRDGTTVLEDIADWNSGALPSTFWEPSPLVFAALKQWALVIPAVNPLMGVNTSDPFSVEHRQAFRDVFSDFVDLGFAAVDFPAETELLVFDAYATAGKHPKEWTVAEIDAVLDEDQIAASWWAPLVELGEPTSASAPWADPQRDFMRIHRRAVDYWLDERLIQGEFGGGPGDDVELLLQMFATYAARRDQADRRVIDRLDSMMRSVLFDNGIVQDGYYAGPLTDVQHAAEYTTNPFLIYHSLFGATPMSSEIALGVAQRLRFASDPELAFAEPTSAGRLHFKSWFFTANEISDKPNQAVDALINGRAMVPGVVMGMRSALGAGHPMILDLTSWARAMRDDALDVPAQSNGKPLGFVAPVSVPSNDIGADGVWYSRNGDPNDTKLFTSGVSSYALGAMAFAYERSLDSDRWRFLLPVTRMFRAVQDWEDAGEPNGASGTKWWAAKSYRNDSRFGPTVVRMMPLLLQDASLTSLTDPVNPSTTYVDDDLIERMRKWSEVDFLNQNNAIRYALGDVIPCSTGFNAKSINSLVTPYTSSIALHRTFMPILTARAYHTDRVFLRVFDAPNMVLAGHSGDTNSEGLFFRPRVRWTSRMADPLQLAVSCNERDDLGHRYSAFVHNAASTPANVTLELATGLVRGTYRIDIGEGDIKCDLFQPGVVLTSTVVEKRGDGTKVDIVIPPGLQMVKIVRIGGASAAPKYDLAVDLPQMKATLPDVGSPTLTLSARVANLGSAVSPSVTLDWVGAVLSPDGLPLLLGGAPIEVPIASQAIPSLVGANGFTMTSYDAEITVPVDAAVVSTFLGGFGVQLEARVRTDLLGSGRDFDELNDRRTKGVFLEELEVVVE